MSNKRIDQYLFKDIVKQCYEAQSAYKNYLKEYSLISNREKEGYKYFSCKTRKLLRGLNRDEENILIFEKWFELTDEEQEKWKDPKFILQLKFQDVDTFLRMFSHNR